MLMKVQTTLACSSWDGHNRIKFILLVDKLCTYKNNLEIQHWMLKKKKWVKNWLSRTLNKEASKPRVKLEILRFGKVKSIINKSR